MDFRTSSSNSTISTPDAEFSDGIDYYKSIDQAMDQFFIDIQKEDRLLAEVSYNLSTSLLLGTGISMARNCTPAVKIWVNNAFSSDSEGISFNSFDWNDFVGHLKSTGMDYLYNNESTPFSIKIGDYLLSSQLFLDEKVLKLEHGSKSLHLNKQVASRVCEVDPLIKQRLKILEESSFCCNYYKILEMVFVIAGVNAEEEKMFDLLRQISSCAGSFTQYCMSELLLLYKPRLLKDLEYMKYNY